MFDEPNILGSQFRGERIHLLARQLSVFRNDLYHENMEEIHAHLDRIIVRNFGIYKSDAGERQQVIEEAYKIFIYQVQQEHQEVRGEKYVSIENVRKFEQMYKKVLLGIIQNQKDIA